MEQSMSLAGKMNAALSAGFAHLLSAGRLQR